MAAGLLASPGFVQAQATGSIEGTLFDRGGMPLPGVRVTATSPTQIGGVKTLQSDAEGGFRFTGLFPGVFEVRAAANKLKTVVQPGVKVGLSAASVDLIMEVETAEEQVVILSKSPVIDTKSARVKERLDGDFLVTLPGGNRNWTEIMSLAAGADGTRVRGAGEGRNAATLDGFNTLDPFDGGPSQLVSIYSIAATEISTAGAGAAFGSTSGGVAEMITRSGSNRFELDAEVRYREPRTVEPFQEPGEDDRDEYWLQGILNLGGPVIQDRLWYFLSFDGLFITRYPLNPSSGSHAKVQGEGLRKPDHSPPGRYIRPTFLQKVTYQLAPRHKVQALAVTTPESTRYGGWENYYIDPTADQYLNRLRTLYGLSWEALLFDDLFNRFQVAYQAMRSELGPMACIFGDKSSCLDEPQVVDQSAGGFSFGNAETKWTERVGGFQFKNTTEWIFDSGRTGAHALTLGLDFQLQERETSEIRTGGGRLFVQNTLPYRKQVYCPTDLTSASATCTDGRLDKTVNGIRFDAFLQDAWRVTRQLTATLGVGLHRAAYKNNEGVEVFDGTAITPHVALAWDATRDGRTVLRSNYNQYADLAGLKLADFGSRTWSSKTCDLNPQTGLYDQSCTFINGAPAANRRIAKGLKVPKVHEVTLGAEREFIEGVALGADVIYKNFVNQYEDYEINRVWNAGGTGLATGGGYRNGQPTPITELRTQPNAKRRYLGTTVQLSKREGAFRALASYTWTTMRGRQPVPMFDYRTEWGDNPSQDIYYSTNSPLAGERKHEVLIKASHLVSDWLQFGGIYRFRTGAPYNHRFFNRVTNGFSDLRATQGYSAGVNVNDPRDDRALRLPDTTTFDLQARANLKRFIRVNLSVFVDYHNVLGLRGVTSIQQNDGPTFGAVTSRQGASWLQLGVRYAH